MTNGSVQPARATGQGELEVAGGRSEVASLPVDRATEEFQRIEPREEGGSATAGPPCLVAKVAQARRTSRPRLPARVEGTKLRAPGRASLSRHRPDLRFEQGDMAAESL